jgi:hypothetical protein
MNDLKMLTKEIDTFLAKNVSSIKFPDLVLARSLNETWFSDTLAWLLDPKGSHKLGVSFINEFLKTVASKRSSGDYARRQNMLKKGKSGKGVSAAHFSLKNAAVIREFYLAKAVNKSDARGPKFCDLAVIDLDSKDGLILIVENKLFTSNHPGQLEQYFDAVEKKFKRAKIREYVYLTIPGLEPLDYKDGGIKKYKYWVNMSWTGDILDIIIKTAKGKNHPEIRRINNILKWMKKISNGGIQNYIEDLRQALVQGTAVCLKAELERLGEGKTGKWEIKKENGKSIRIGHSTYHKTKLYIELLPNLSITVQSRKKGKPIFDKIIVPYGSNPDQIFNLLDIAARDIYGFVFSENLHRYLANKNRLTSRLIPEKLETKSLFEYVAKNQNSLKVLFAFSKNIWNAQKCEIEETLN